MATALTVLLTVSLLQGALCAKFKVIMPQTIDALSGSCVTIPCSFDVPNIHEPNLGPETSANSQDRVMFPVFITTVFTLLVLVCALLFVIRIRWTQHNLQEGQRTGDTSRVMSQLLTSGEGNEIPNTTEEDIYVNSEALRQADVAHPTIISEPNRTNLQGMRPNNAEGARKSSEKEKGNTDIYSSVYRNTRKKTENSLNMHQPGSASLE
ncbi:Schwann cell myelin protein [Dissostichus eleginoides]|uniref:Schwann cell myelin protein n=1 Tax=Dissostichus eleginoides TaxID=100907 RepID=A0AAD9FB46_DISEL|nr:Schwann cell myelin protein [Dissostichus eleginoides]